MGIQYLSTGRSYIKRQPRNGLFILLHTHINTPSWPCCINYGSCLEHVDISPVRTEHSAKREANATKIASCNAAAFFHICLFAFFLSPPPLSRPLYWYFSAFSLSPLSPIAAAVGFELSHFPPLHFLLSAAIICTWRMSFLIIMPDKRSRSPSSVKRMCI